MTATDTSTRPDVELVLPARPESVAVVRHVLAGVGDALGMDERAVADLRLAVSEACTNVVVHAYVDEGEDDDGQVMEIEAAARGTLLHVTVRDHGRGMEPPATEPGLGLGLPIVDKVASSMELRSGPAGNEVSMTFVLPGGAGA